MNKGKKIYEGKAKILYETKDKDLIIKSIIQHKIIIHHETSK